MDTQQSGNHLIQKFFKQKIPPLLGLDISTSAVRLLALDATSGGYRVQACAQSRLPHGAVAEGSVTDAEAVARAVGEVAARAGGKRRQVALAVSGAQIISRQIAMPVEFSDSDIEQQITLESDQYIPFPEVRELMKVLDVPVRQVLIESRIVNASTNFSKNLGVRFGASDRRDIAGGTTAVSGNLNGTTQLINGDTLQANDRLNVNMPAQRIQGIPFNPTSIGLAIAKLPFGRLLELELSALQAEGEGEIISNPRVLTSNQKEATISQGTEFPYQEAAASGATTTDFKEAVLELKVTPQITPDDHIIMDISVNKDALNTTATNNNGEPAIDTQKVESQVLVNDGETIVIGGIYEQTKTNSVVRTPFFGDLPYIGMLFRNRSGTNEKKELLIFVTPKIVREELATSVR